MTNLALLARVHPDAFARIGRVVFMGGGVDISNATAAAEFNVFHDPEATAIVLDACATHGIPVTMYGLDVFYDPLVTDTDVDGLRALGTPVADLAAGLISFHHRRFANSGRRSAMPGRSASSSSRMPCAPSACPSASSSPAPGPAGAPSSTAATGPGTWRTTRTAWPRRRSRSASGSTGRGSPTCGCAPCGVRPDERAGGRARVAQRRPRDARRAASAAGGDGAR
jgi:hypothetical protein